MKRVLVLFFIIITLPVVLKAKAKSDKNLKKWVIEEVHRLGQMHLTEVGNVTFGELIFGFQKIKHRDIAIFKGNFSDSTGNERLVCIEATTTQKTGSTIAQGLTLLIKYSPDEKGCYSIELGRPSPIFDKNDLIDIDGDGYLDIVSEVETMHESIKEHWAEVYSLKKNKILFQISALDKWSNASNSQKVLAIEGDILYEEMEIIRKCRNTKTFLLVERTKYICGGGETVKEIKNRIIKKEELFQVELNK